MAAPANPVTTRRGPRRFLFVLAVAAAAVAGGMGVSKSMPDHGSSAPTAGRSWSIMANTNATAMVARPAGRSWS